MTVSDRGARPTRRQLSQGAAPAPGRVRPCRPSVSVCACLCGRPGVCPCVPGCSGGGCVSGRRPVSQGGPGCCCGRQCGGRGGADGGPGGEAPCGGRGCSLLSAFPLAGPIPAASFPSALCELRRGRGGSAGGPVIPRTHRDRRSSGFAPAGGRRDWRCRRRPPFFQARAARRSGSRPGLGSAPKRPRLFVLGGRGVWRQSLLPPPRRGPEWLRSRGWAGTAG